MSGFERVLAGRAVVYRSPLLSRHGVPHVFTTRHGGHSQGPYRSLNLGLGCGDDDATVAHNRERLCELFGLPANALRTVQQVHAADLVDAADLAPDRFAADGLYTTQPGLLLSVRVADCLPVLFSTTDGSAVAAVHAGWRGLAEGILPHAVETLTNAANCAAADLLVAVGPAIGVARYEVGQEVLDAVPHACSTAFDRPHLDLAATAEAQLRAAEVVQIDLARLCTYDSPDFFSHRRDAGVTGRQAGAITIRG